MEKGEIFPTDRTHDMSDASNGDAAAIGPDQTIYCGFREYRDAQGNPAVEVLIRKPVAVQNGQGEEPALKSA